MLKKSPTRLSLLLAGLCLLAVCPIYSDAQQIPAAVTADPPPDAKQPARMIEVVVPSHDSNMNGIFYLAAGAGAHPTVLLLHGFPGNEQNTDLAQSMRRAGWNVLMFHYRGSWGSQGAFSFTHSIEDTDVAVDFLTNAANDAKYGIDPRMLVVIGHSMGGFMALHTAASHPQLAGVAVISAWDIGAQARNVKVADEAKMIEQFRAEVAPLAGCTAESLVVEAKSNAVQWDFVQWAPALKGMPMLVVEADDGLGPDNAALAAAARKAGDARVTELHMTTDHGFNDHRIALQAAVVAWLQGIEKK